MKNYLLVLILSFTFTNYTFGQSLAESLEGETTLSDEQNKEALNFVHEGKKQSQLNEQCAQLQGGCDANSVEAQGSVFKGEFLQIIENNIGKLYAVLYGGMSLAGGKGPSVKVVGKPEEEDGKDKAEEGKEKANVTKLKGKEKKAKASEKADYCAYAAMGYEVVGTFVQTGLQSKIEDRLSKDKELAKDQQKLSLVALQQNHEARRTTSIIQGSIYSATAACYITRAIASKGRVVMDFGYIAKMSASSALALLYHTKAKKHKEAAKIVGKIIDDLPGAGDCNPWTKTTCFCAEATSKTLYPDLFQDICILNNGNANYANTNTACGKVQPDGSIINDPSCECKKTNTCYKVSLNPNSVNFNTGKNFMGLANQGYDLMNNGEFKEGQFSAYAMNAAAQVKKAKSKIATNKVKSPALSKEEKLLADSLTGELGADVARMIASSPSSSLASDLGGPSLSPTALSANKNLQDEVESKANLKYSSTGSGFGSADSSSEAINPFASLNQGTESENSTEVLSFAEKAMQNNADVNVSPDRPLFEIISNRYMKSGWKKIESSELK